MNQTSTNCPQLDANLDEVAKNLVPKNMDWFLPIVGRERSGKSNLGIYCGIKVEEAQGRKFTKDNIFHSSEEYLSRAENMPNGSAILIDEGGEVMFNRDWQSQQNKTMAKIFMTCGFKNFFIIFIMPAFFSMDKYIRIHRASAMLMTEFYFDKEKREPVRGFFKSYGAEKLRRIHTSKQGTMIFPRPDFAERCPNMQEENPTLWKDYQELEHKRKTDMMRKALKEHKKKKNLDDFVLPEVEEIATSL